MEGWLNVGSLVLGLVAWILPITAMMFSKKPFKNWLVFLVVSFSACAVSICFQLAYNNYLVQIEDWSALMDTSSAVTSAATILLIVTILLNIGSFTVYRYRMKR